MNILFTLIQFVAAIQDYNTLEQETEQEQETEHEAEVEEAIEEAVEEMTVDAEITATLQEVEELEDQMKVTKDIPVNVVRLPCCAHKVRNRKLILD